MPIDVDSATALYQQELKDAIEAGEPEAVIAYIHNQIENVESDLRQLSEAPDPDTPCRTCNGGPNRKGQYTDCGECGGPLTQEGQASGGTNLYPRNEDGKVYSLSDGVMY